MEYAESIGWLPACGKSFNLASTSGPLTIRPPIACRIVGVAAKVTTKLDAAATAPVVSASAVDADGSSHAKEVTITIPDNADVGSLWITRLAAADYILVDPIQGDNLSTPALATNREIVLKVKTAATTAGVADCFVLVALCGEAQVKTYASPEARS